MKTILISSLSLLAISMLLFSSSLAQQKLSQQFAYLPSSDKLNTTFLSADTKNSPNENVSVTGKTMKHFNKRFHNTANVKWEQLDDNFLATFVKSDITTKSLFNKKGRLIYTIECSSEKELPDDIKILVMNKYENYAITRVAKVEEDDRKIWVVNLAGTKNYIAVRVEDDDIAETENFMRAN